MRKTEIEKETGVSNKRRTQWAYRSIVAYRTQVHSQDLEDDIPDLVADLLHLAKANGIDPEVVLDKAKGHFEYESRLG